MKECLSNLRKTKPLIHCITNYVTVNDVANIIHACGASPIMADDELEVEEITSICSGLDINIGTLNKNTIASMVKAGIKAKELGHKVLLDPVGAGASALRTDTALRILNEVKPDVIRGNISEIKTLALGAGTTKGVDADVSDAVGEANINESVQFVKKFARSIESVVAVTGAIDIVTDGDKCYLIRNGRAQMGDITGTGCQLSGLMTAFISANPDNILKAAVTAVSMMGLAGEIAWNDLQDGEGNSTYRNRIIDTIYNMDGHMLEIGAKIEEV